MNQTDKEMKELPEINKTVIVETTEGKLFKTRLLELSQGYVKWENVIGQVKKWSYYNEFNQILENRDHHAKDTN